MNLTASAAGVAAARALGMAAAFGFSVFVAYRFGSDRSTDLAFVALAIPQTLMILVLSSYPSVFVATFKSIEVNRGGGPASAFARSAPLGMAVLGAGAAMTGVVLSPLLARLVAGDFPADQIQRISLYMEVGFALVLFAAVEAAIKGLLNAQGTFFVPALETVAANGAAITVIALTAGAWKEFSLVAGMVAGGAAKLLLVAPSYLRRWRPGMGPLIAPEMRSSMGWIALYCIVCALNLALLRALASRVAHEGAVSHLAYAEKIFSVPLEIFVASMGVVLLPSLAASAAAGDLTELRRRVTLGLRMATFFGLPAAAGLAILAHPIVALVYERGRFDATDTFETARCLAAYSGVVAFSGTIILAQAFYAINQTKLLLAAGVLTFAINAILGIMLVKSMAQSGVALAYAISHAACFAIMLAFFSVRAGRPDLRGLASGALRTALCTAVMAGGVWALGKWTPAHVLLRAAAGVAIFAAMARILCPAEWGLARILGRRSRLENEGDNA